jgi:hypothetical protein
VNKFTNYKAVYKQNPPHASGGFFYGTLSTRQLVNFVEGVAEVEVAKVALATMFRLQQIPDAGLLLIE